MTSRDELLGKLAHARNELDIAWSTRTQLAGHLSELPAGSWEADRWRVELYAADRRFELYRLVVAELTAQLTGAAPRCPFCAALLPFHFDECAEAAP